MNHVSTNAGILKTLNPHHDLARWFHERVGETRGRFKRIMIVALARKLIIALWRYLATGVVPDGARVTTA